MAINEDMSCPNVVTFPSIGGGGSETSVTRKITTPFGTFSVKTLIIIAVILYFLLKEK